MWTHLNLPEDFFLVCSRRSTFPPLHFLLPLPQSLVSLYQIVYLFLSFSLLQIQQRSFTTQQKLFFILAWEKTGDFSLQTHFSYSAVLSVLTGPYPSFIKCLDDLVSNVFTWSLPLKLEERFSIILLWFRRVFRIISGIIFSFIFFILMSA